MGSLRAVPRPQKQPEAEIDSAAPDGAAERSGPPNPGRGVGLTHRAAVREPRTRNQDLEPASTRDELLRCVGLVTARDGEHVRLELGRSDDETKVVEEQLPSARALLAERPSLVGDRLGRVVPILRGDRLGPGHRQSSVRLDRPAPEVDQCFSGELLRSELGIERTADHGFGLSHHPGSSATERRTASGTTLATPRWRNGGLSYLIRDQAAILTGEALFPARRRRQGRRSATGRQRAGRPGTPRPGPRRPRAGTDPHLAAGVSLLLPERQRLRRHLAAADRRQPGRTRRSPLAIISICEVFSSGRSPP